MTPGDLWSLDVAGLTVPPASLTGSVAGSRGTFLQSTDCVGVPPIDAPIVDRAFVGVGGFVNFTILTVDANGGFTADVSLQGLVVAAEDDSNSVCSVPDRTLSGLGFGYRPP